jgi:hypothetical protein
MEVRAAPDLLHVDESTLRAMSQKGFAGKDINGEPLVLHHLGQNPAGPVVEMPAFRHNVHNRVQHPFGNTPGAGLTKEQRAAFDVWREDYWRARALEELQRRGLTP